MEEQLDRITLVRPSPAEELFARVGLSRCAREAYKYSQETGLYEMFCGGAEFGPDLYYSHMQVREVPILVMTVDGDNDTTFVVGAKTLTDGKVYGHCLLRQGYGDGGSCVMCVYLENDRPKFFEVIVNGTDFAGRPARASFCYELNLPGDELTIIQILEKCGWEGEIKGKVRLDDVERLMHLMANGRFFSSVRVSVQDVMCRIGDLLVQD